MIYLCAGSRSPGPEGLLDSYRQLGAQRGEREREDTCASQALPHLPRLTPARCRDPACALTPHSLAPRQQQGLRWRGTGRSALPLRWSGRARPLLSAPKTAPAGTESFAVGRIEPWRCLGAFCTVRGRISCAGTVLV